MNDPGAAAARRRVGTVLERLARVEFQVLVVAPPDATRLAARDRARGAALVAGRGALLDEASAAAREVTIKAFARAAFSGTWAATDMAVSVVRADDRVAAAAASEEAAMAAVVEDLVDEDTLEVLRATTDELEGSKGIPTPGSLTAFARPRSGVVRPPGRDRRADRHRRRGDRARHRGSDRRSLILSIGIAVVVGESCEAVKSVTRLA